MDEQEVPENSSEEISKRQLHDSDGIAPAQSDDAPSEADVGDSKANSNSGADTDEANFALSPEELPTMQWSDVYAELAEFERQERASQQEMTTSSSAQLQPDQTGPLAGLEEAMSWLEELAAGQGMPIDEMPTLVTAQPVVDEPAQEQDISAQEIVLDEPSNDDVVRPELVMDSDPMAWLEQLAVDQSSPLEELPSVADRLLASEIISQTEIPPNSTINDPYDVDQALVYLEQLAITQGVDLTEVTFEVDQPLNSLDSTLTIIDGLALTGLAASALIPDSEIPDPYPEIPGPDPEISAAKSEVIPDRLQDFDSDELPQPDQWSDLSADMPDDPQQALHWLGNVGDEGDGMEVVEEADTVGARLEISDPDTAAKAKDESDNGALESVAEEPQNDADALQEMPDDPDEAVAWMEKLATDSARSQTAESGAPASQKEQESHSVSESSIVQNDLLRDAQVALDEGDPDKALAIYQAVLDEEAASDDVLAALEEAVDSHQDSPGLLRLLGDAYMQMGEVDKAISTYRRGFDHL